MCPAGLRDIRRETGQTQLLPSVDIPGLCPLLLRYMKRFILPLVALALAATSPAVEQAKLLDKANVLPLALDDAFQFRKTKTFFYDPKVNKQVYDNMLKFERDRISYGAITLSDRRERWGHYYTFIWRTARPADLT